MWLPYREYLGWKERSHSFEWLRRPSFANVTLTTTGEARTMLGLDVTPEFFTTFGVGALLGRTLSQDDLQGPHAVVLSYGERCDGHRKLALDLAN